MEKIFTTIEDVKNQFSISDENLDVIEKKLEKLLAENHPDKTGGEFKDKNQKEDFYLIQQAIEFLQKEKQNNSQLIPISAFNSLVEMFKENKDAEITKNNNAIIQNSIDKEIRKIPSQNLMPKISLSTITTIITGIWLFPNTIIEHPVLSKYIDTGSKGFIIFWLILLYFTGSFWFITAVNEKRQKKYLESLNTEYFQDSIFFDFSNEYYNRPFSKSDLVGYLIERGHKSISRIFSINNYGISASLAESIASQIIDTALNRKIIEEIKSNSLSPRYKIKKNESDFED